MRDSEKIWKPAAIVFLASLIFYFAAFYAIEWRRALKGPWRITFTVISNTPAILVNQPTLHLRDVQIRFPGARAAMANGPQTLVFDKPHRAPPYPAPFGRVLFFDTTFLPGSVTFELFGNVVELLPRVLIVNHREIPWRSEAVYSFPSGRRSP